MPTKVITLAPVVKQSSQTLSVKPPVKPRQSSQTFHSLDKEVDDLLALPAHEGQLPQYLPETWGLPDRPKQLQAPLQPFGQS
jgi:hypothetical protein